MTTGIQDLPFITKIVQPRPRGDSVERPRVAHLMKAALGKRIALVWAPAGYGKTTTVALLADQPGCRVCWYSLSEEDSEPALFVRYCRRAVESVLGTLDYPPKDASSAPLDPSWKASLGRLVTDLSTRLKTQLLFVFDDLHELNGCRETQEALSLLLERSPQNLRFALLSRTRPSLPCLPRLTIQGEVSSVDMEALRFSAEEASQLLSRAWGRPVEDHEARAVVEHTSGWPAAIALVGQTCSDVEAIRRGEALGTATLFEYLTEEVVKKLPAGDQLFLLHTSVLKDFTVELCNKLLGRADSLETIGRLRESGCLIDERPGAVSTYYYHDLFRTYLERFLRERDPASHVALNRKAASLAEGRGDHGAAIAHLMSAGAHDEAGLLIKRVSGSYFEKGRWQTVQGWLSLLPAEVGDRDPELLLVRANVQQSLGRTIEAVECLDKAIATSAPSDNLILGKALVARSYAKRLLGDLAGAVGTATEGIRVLREADAPGKELAEGYRQLASAHGTRGELKEAQKYLEMALALAPDSNLELRSLIHDGLAAMHLESAQLDAAAAHLEQARQGWIRLKNEGALARTLNNLAVAYYWRGEFAVALDELREAARAAGSTGNQRWLVMAHVTEGIVLRAQRRYQEALEQFQAGLDEARRILDHRLVAEAISGLGNTYRRLGDPEKAEVFLGQALLQAEESGQEYLAARYRTALGKVFCQIGVFDKALAQLERAESWFTEHDNYRGLAETEIHKGLALSRMGRMEGALQAMRQAGESVERLGYEGFLVADADEALPLIRLSVAKGVRSLKGLLRRLEAKPEDHDHQGAHDGAVALPAIAARGFGMAQVYIENHAVGDREWRSRKAKELFFFLLCKRGTVSKEQMIEALWPEGTLEEYADALRENVYRLRRALYNDCVVTRGDHYSIHPGLLVDFDRDRFEGLLLQAQDTSRGVEERAELLQQAVALYQGLFLEEFYSEWAERLRRSLEDKYRGALMRLAKYLMDTGKSARAIEVVKTAVATDPYDEPAHLLLARGYLHLGDPLSALRCLREFAARLHDELQAQPSAGFYELYQQALTAGPFGVSAAR